VVPSLQTARRRFGIAVALSVLLHALLIVTLPARRQTSQTLGGAPPPMQVTLDAPQAAVAEIEPQPSAVPTPPTATPPPPRPRVLASREPSKRPAPPPPPEEVKPPPPPPQPPPPQFDMAALIAARQAQKRAAEAAAARGPQGPPEPSPSDSTAASINRNLQTLGPDEGVGGLFQILRKGSLSGTFSFDGYRPDRGKRWREVIEVQAGADGDIEKAMVQRMIELIRSHYSGDFNFRSQRLGRIVVKSARPEDQADLEQFLAWELFGVPVLNRTK
jgi:outer membrane biosynthesis protein TonB